MTSVTNILSHVMNKSGYFILMSMDKMSDCRSKSNYQHAAESCSSLGTLWVLGID